MLRCSDDVKKTGKRKEQVKKQLKDKSDDLNEKKL